MEAGSLSTRGAVGPAGFRVPGPLPLPSPAARPPRVELTTRRAEPHLRRTGRQQIPRFVPRSVADTGSGGGGSGAGKGGSGGGGGGGGGDGSSGGDGKQEPTPPEKSGLLKGWEERVAFDPEFPVKVAMEQIIGVGASVIGDMSSRPNWGLNELDFVFSTLVVGSIMNFSIMYLLAPTASVVGGASGGLLARALSEQTLKGWGAPGGNMFEAGTYSLGARLLNFGYKGVTFAAIGFLAGVTGTAISNTLLVLRKQLDPNFRLVNEQPNVLANAGTWGLHMGLSSNLRYQVLGGLDPVVAGVLPLPLFRVFQAGIRAANNVVGGISFVTLARILGVQKAAASAATPAVEPPLPPAPSQPVKGKGKR